jgi:hypothetical protein
MSAPAFYPIIHTRTFNWGNGPCLFNPWTSLQSILTPCVVLLHGCSRRLLGLEACTAETEQSLTSFFFLHYFGQISAKIIDFHRHFNHSHSNDCLIDSLTDETGMPLLENKHGVHLLLQRFCLTGWCLCFSIVDTNLCLRIIQTNGGSILPGV